MKKFPKAGLLIITLVIPALTFVLLKLFATNHYEVPFFNPKLGTSGNVEVINGDTVFQQVPAITLTSGNVKLEGQLSVIAFFSKDCNDNCKLVLANLQRIYDLRSSVSNLSIHTFTKDSISASSEFRDFGNTGWKVAVVNDKEVSNIQNLRSLPFKQMLELYPGGSGLTLIDKKGYTRGYYDGADPEEVDRLMAEIKIINYEDKASANP